MSLLEDYVDCKCSVEVSFCMLTPSLLLQPPFPYLQMMHGTLWWATRLIQELWY